MTLKELSTKIPSEQLLQIQAGLIAARVSLSAIYSWMRGVRRPAYLYQKEIVSLIQKYTDYKTITVEELFPTTK